MNQPDLFDERPRFVMPDEAASIQERFEAFHRANPWVMQALVRLCQRYQAMGREKVGIGHLWEVLRWEIAKTTSVADGDFRFNDHYRSRYARLIATKNPELATMFEFRALRAA